MHPGSESLRRHRLRRLALLNRILKPYGLKAGENGAGGFVLRGPTGRTALAADLAGLWRAADTVGVRPPDPLDPGLLDALGGDGR